MGQQLDQQQLMSIAKELVDKPTEKMPDYLTKAEEETVKGLVKTLRASQLAMKTYIQKMNYNDALRKQIAIEEQLAKNLERAIRAKAEHATKWSLMIRLTKRMKRALSDLDKANLRAVMELQSEIDMQRSKIVRLFIKNGIPPSSALFREGKEARMNERLYYYLNQTFFGNENEFRSLKEEDAMVAAHGRLISLRDNLRVTNPSLAAAAEQMSQRMYDAENLLFAVYSLPDADVHSALGVRISSASKEMRAAGKEAARLGAELPKQRALTEIERQRTLAMGGWYIVAAMAETFIELGQELAY